jgi:hypothetical protein
MKMKFEKMRHELLPRNLFIIRLSRYLLMALGIITFSLGIGMVGYCYFEDMSFLDALLNASTILDGMGPVTQLKTAWGKIFASVYALFSSFVFIAVAGVVLAPLVHRLLHRFHLDGED